MAGLTLYLCKTMDAELLTTECLRSEFEALVRRYRPLALVVAQRMLLPESAEDAVQEAAVAAFRAIDQLERREMFAAWFCTIVRHQCLRALRRNPRSVSLDTDPGLLAAPPAQLVLMPDDPPPFEWEKVVGCLPRRTRDILRLYYADEFSVGEIATALQIPVTTVKWQLHSARATLRKKLQSYEHF
jgi:RNA polymerase sigma-70 factor (ECF subfamily)